MNDDGKIGYRRPPARTRFKAGTSGNPSGRPKGARNIKTELREELAQRIKIREGDREIRISKYRALIKAMVNKGLRGDTRAMMMVLSLFAKHLEEVKAPERDTLLPEDRTILDAFVEEQLRVRLGRTADQPTAQNPEKTDGK